MNTLLALLKSRKFWLTLPPAVVVFVLVVLGKMPAETAPAAVVSAIALLATFVGSTAYEDAASKQAATKAGEIGAQAAQLGTTLLAAPTSPQVIVNTPGSSVTVHSTTITDRTETPAETADPAKSPDIT